MIFRLLAIFALISPFFFPWQFVAVLAGIVLLRYPAIALAVGLELDALYLAPGAAPVAFATLWGALAMVVALLIRRFIRTHISIV